MRRFCVYILFLALAWTGCTDPNENLIPSKQDEIRSFLDGQQKEYTQIDLNTFRYIRDPSEEVEEPEEPTGPENPEEPTEPVDQPQQTEEEEPAEPTDPVDPEEPLEPEIVAGDEVTLTCWIYPFMNAAISEDQMPLYTNDPVSVERLRVSGVEVDFWDVSPLVVRVGEGDVMPGVDKGLVGCRRGGFVEFYMTFVDAYGKRVVGLLTDKTQSMVFFCRIEQVNGV